MMGLCTIKKRSAFRRGINLLAAVFFTIGPITCELQSTALAQEKVAKKSSKKRKNPSRNERSKKSSERVFFAEGESLADGEKSASRKFVLGTAGLSPQPLIGVGATAGLTRSSGTTLEGGITLASGKKGFVAARVIHTGARYRRPLFGIGYYAAGVGFRMASGAWNVLSTSGSEYATTSSLNAVTADGAIGAQTKFGSLLVGADLVGVSVPLFKLGVKKSALQEPDVDLDDEKKQQEIFDALAGGINLTIAKIGVGVHF